MPQFEKVSCKYGAPMGRHPQGLPQNCDGTIRLFKVNLDSGGYDDGGAYWGSPSDLYCATDDADFQWFTRANSRAEAAENMGLENEQLRRKV